MKRNPLQFNFLWIGTVLLVFALAVGLGQIFQRQVFGQNLSATVAQKKFTYKVVYLNLYEYKQDPQYLKFLKRFNHVGLAQTQFIQLVCNRFGKDGWELVYVDRFYKLPILVLYFKKPLI
ncbi:MAG: hypothetical protein D6805_02405 [Planctomycetota bacterium]|nr:MAG: hypothetical protein D6805_02405 [Planctomycetota bacterium]